MRYGPLYLLDLCILAYQLHSQTLIWPLDPYGEQVKSFVKWEETSEEKNYKKEIEAIIKKTRNLNPNSDAFKKQIAKQRKIEGLIAALKRTHAEKFLAGAKEFFKEKMKSEPDASQRLRGPVEYFGVTTDGNTNHLSTIIYDYTRIDPEKIGFSRQNVDLEGLTIYDVPKEITNRIGDVWMVSRKPCMSPVSGLGSTGGPYVEKLKSSKDPKKPDRLFCLEGITGRRMSIQGGSFGMLAFILARLRDADDPAQAPGGGAKIYDLFVVFRGSRSGNNPAEKAIWGSEGSPDWVTNTATNKSKAGMGKVAGGLPENLSTIDNRKGKNLHIGFGLAVASICPAISAAMKEVNKLGLAIGEVHITGHSLGGALATTLMRAIQHGDNKNLDELKKKAAADKRDGWSYIFSAAWARNKDDFQETLGSGNLFPFKFYVDGDAVNTAFEKGGEAYYYNSKGPNVRDVAISLRLPYPSDGNFINTTDPHSPEAVRVAVRPFNLGTHTKENHSSWTCQPLGGLRQDVNIIPRFLPNAKDLSNWLFVPSLEQDHFASYCKILSKTLFNDEDCADIDKYINDAVLEAINLMTYDNPDTFKAAQGDLHNSENVKKLVRRILYGRGQDESETEDKNDTVDRSEANELITPEEIALRDFVIANLVLIAVQNVGKTGLGSGPSPSPSPSPSTTATKPSSSSIPQSPQLGSSKDKGKK
ncbi:MAG: hypothetical protein R3C04_10440 [Hyphomonas sp.]